MQSDNLAAATNSAASPGARLRVAREARGESVHEVAFAIKLSPRQVEALEKDDFAALPGMAFVRGFARNYARYLGLDAAPLLDGIERMGGADQPDLSPIRNADGDLPAGGAGRRGSFPAGAVVAVLLVLLGVGWYFDWFRTEPPATLELQPEPAPGFAPAPTEGGSASGASGEPVVAPALVPLAPVMEAATLPPAEAPAVTTVAVPASPAAPAVVVQSMTNTDTADARHAMQVAELARRLRAGAHHGQQRRAAAAVPKIRDRLLAMTWTCRWSATSTTTATSCSPTSRPAPRRWPSCASIRATSASRPQARPAVRAIVELACRYDKPVRIGVNWGSLDQSVLARIMDANAKRAEPRTPAR
jgi:cytoskeletal protein RodZ